MYNPTPHMLQCWGVSIGSMPYQINTASLHSYDIISVQLAVQGVTNTHAPILWPWRRWRAYIGKSPPHAAFIAYPATWNLRLLISVNPSQNSWACSPDRKLTWHCRAATRCPVSTHEAVHFPWEVCVSVCGPVWWVHNFELAGLWSSIPVWWYPPLGREPV